MSASPHSPSAPNDESEHEEPAPDAEDESMGGDPPPAEAQPASARGDGDAVEVMNDRKFWVAYGKDIFDMPKEQVVFDCGHPILVASGESAGEIVDSKSFKTWSEAGIKGALGTRHIIKVRVKQTNGVSKVGFYVTFKVQDKKSNDPLILRTVHKTIAKKLYDKWMEEWSEAKKEKFAELLADEPSEEAQINPERAGWNKVQLPPNVLYRRPKKEKKEREGSLDAPPPKKQKAAVGKLAAPPEADEAEEEDEPPSTALVPVPQQADHMGGMGGMGGSYTPIFTDHPDTVKIPVVLYEKMAAVYYSQLAAQRAR